MLLNSLLFTGQKVCAYKFWMPLRMDMNNCMKRCMDYEVGVFSLQVGHVMLKEVFEKF